MRFFQFLLIVPALWHSLSPSLSNAATLASPAAKPCTSVEQKLEAAGTTVRTSSYTPDAKAARRSVIVLLPPTGGVNPIDTKYATRLCRYGYEVAIMVDWNGLHLGDPVALDYHDRVSRATLAAVSLVLDVHPGKPAGLFGTSLGAIHGAMATAIDPRIKMAVLVVGGGGPADVIAHTNQKSLAELRTLRMKQYGFRDVNEYQARLEAEIQVDPVRLAAQATQKALYFVIATRDKTVPTSTQVTLANAWKNSGSSVTISKLPLGHISAVVAASIFFRGKTERFFLKHLE
jgi:hypothetical protein